MMPVQLPDSTRSHDPHLLLFAGTFFVSLFSLASPLRFPRSCLASIFYLAAELVVAQDQHLGSHFFAGFALMGQLILGILWAGFMASLLVVATTGTCTTGQR